MPGKGCGQNWSANKHVRLHWSMASLAPRLNCWRIARRRTWRRPSSWLGVMGVPSRSHRYHILRKASTIRRTRQRWSDSWCRVKQTVIAQWFSLLITFTGLLHSSQIEMERNLSSQASQRLHNTEFDKWGTLLRCVLFLRQHLSAFVFVTVLNLLDKKYFCKCYVVFGFLVLVLLCDVTPLQQSQKWKTSF